MLSAPSGGPPILTLVYIALSVLGCGYVLVSVLMGHGDLDGGSHGDAGDGGNGGDGSGHTDGDAHAHSEYGIQGEGHGTASTGAASAAAFHFPFFSPLALATLFGSIGGWGLITRQGLGLTDRASLLASVPAAVATAYLVTYLGWKVMVASRGSSQIRTSDLEGVLAEVITPIPAGGMGEAAAMVNGQRFTNPARSVDGRPIPRGVTVRVLRLVGGTFVVQTKEG
jgi:hypothetical protein